eukprot:144761_1
MIYSVLAFAWLSLIAICSGQINPTYMNSTEEYYINSVSGTIICNKPKCIITCDITSGCDGIIINATSSNTLILTCTALSSCNNIYVVDGPSNLTEFHCTHSSCQYSNFTVPNTPNVFIECNYDKCSSGCSSTQGACLGSIFDAEFATNVNILCGYSFDCLNTDFNINHTFSAVVNSGSRSALYTGTNIIGTYIQNQLTINCDYEYSCYQANIFCPKMAICNVNCIGNYGCHGSNFYFVTENSLYFNLVCPVTQSCDNLQFICQDTGATSYHVYAENNAAHACTSYECCPLALNYSKVLQCSELFGKGTDCVIDCSTYGCPVKTYINGSDAKSLTINCDSSYECQFTDVFCPYNGDCIINCRSQYSCEFMKFVHDEISSLSLNCLYSKSCEKLSMDLTVTNIVNISCLVVDSCKYANIDLTINNLGFIHCSSCEFATFNIKGIKNMTQLQINAVDSHALQSAHITLININTINISCIYNTNKQACFNLYFSTLYVNSINIQCIGLQTCQASNWNLNAKNIALYCNGQQSCTYMNIVANINNSLSVTTTSNNNFLGIGSSHIFQVQCTYCANIFNCMENITIYCGTNAIPYDIQPHDQCRNCECNAQQSHDLLFSNNMWQQCTPTPFPTTNPSAGTWNPSSIPTINQTQLTLLPTLNPLIYTINPTTVNPTPIPTVFPIVKSTENIPVDLKNNESKDYIIYIVIVMAVLIIILIIVVCMMYFKQKSKNNEPLQPEISMESMQKIQSVSDEPALHDKGTNVGSQTLSMMINQPEGGTETATDVINRQDTDDELYDNKEEKENVEELLTPTGTSPGEKIEMNFRICYQCNAEKTEKQGCIDQNDGRWYCSQCWSDFQE